MFWQHCLFCLRTGASTWSRCITITTASTRRCATRSRSWTGCRRRSRARWRRSAAARSTSTASLSSTSTSSAPYRTSSRRPRSDTARAAAASPSAPSYSLRYGIHVTERAKLFAEVRYTCHRARQATR